MKNKIMKIIFEYGPTVLLGLFLASGFNSFIHSFNDLAIEENVNRTIKERIEYKTEKKEYRNNAKIAEDKNLKEYSAKIEKLEDIEDCIANIIYFNTLLMHEKFKLDLLVEFSELNTYTLLSTVKISETLDTFYFNLLYSSLQINNLRNDIIKFHKDLDLFDTSFIEVTTAIRIDEIVLQKLYKKMFELFKEQNFDSDDIFTYLNKLEQKSAEVKERYIKIRDEKMKNILKDMEQKEE